MIDRGVQTTPPFIGPFFIVLLTLQLSRVLPPCRSSPRKDTLNCGFRESLNGRIVSRSILPFIDLCIKYRKTQDDSSYVNSLGHMHKLVNIFTH